MEDGPVLIVTGGGTGIGAAVARSAARSGWQVAACGRREAPLALVAREPGVEAIVTDAADPAGVDMLVRTVLDRHGRIDGVVANAGVLREGAVADTSDDDWAETLRVNLTGPFLLARATLPHLAAAGGALVGVSSIAGLQPPMAAAAYATSKAGLAMLVRSIARDYGGQGVRANVVCPGWVRTEMADAEMSEFGSTIGAGVEAAYAEVTTLVPQRRPGRAEEVAAAVLWLLGPESSYVNGAVLTVDGGTTTVDAGTVPLDFSVVPRG